MGDYRDYIVKGKKDPRLQGATPTTPSSDIFSGIANFAGGAANTMMDMTSNLASGASKALIDVSSNIMNPLQGIQNAYNMGEQVVRGTGDIAGGLYESAVGLAQGNMGKSGEGLLRTVKGAANVGSAPLRLIPYAGTYLGNTGEGLSSGIREGAKGIGDIAGGLYGMGNTLLTNPGSQKGIDSMAQVMHGASSLINAPFVAGMSSLPQGAQEGVGKVFAPAMDAVSRTYDDLIQKTGADPKSKEAQRLKTALNDVFNVGSVVFPMANAGKIAKGVQGASETIGKIPGAFGKGISAGGKEFTKSVTGVTFDDLAFNYRNPELAGKVSAGKITPESTFGQITGKLDDLQKNKFGLGKQYEGILSKTPDFKIDHSPMVDFTKKRLKLDFSPQEGFIKTRNTLVSDTELNKLNNLFKDKILYNDFTGENFKAARDSLRNIADFDGSPSSGALKNYAKNAYNEFNTLYRKNLPGMEALDAKFSSAEKLFKPLREEFLKKTSNGWEVKKGINEDTITRVFTNKTKRKALEALEREIPGITKELEALVVHANLNRANVFNTPGAYVRAGTIMGGAATSLATMNPFPLIGSLLTNPTIVSAGARQLGKLFGKGESLIKPMIGGSPLTKAGSFNGPKPGAVATGERAAATGFPQLQSPLQQKLLGAPSAVYAKGPAIRMREKTPNANLTDIPQINPNGKSFTQGKPLQEALKPKLIPEKKVTTNENPIINEKTGETLNDAIQKLKNFGWSENAINKYRDAILGKGNKKVKKLPNDIVTVYRGAPKNQKSIVPGDFITTNYDLAKSYAGEGNVLSKKVKASEILDDANESLGEEYIYRPRSKDATTVKTASEVLGKEFTPVIDESLTSLEKIQSRKAQEYANANYPAIREKYLAKNGVPDENGGYKSITINTDDFRDYLNDGPDKKAYTGTNAHVGHEAASLLSNALYKEALIMQKGKGNNTILTLAGGGGSGKGSASKMFVDQSQYPLVLDQVFGNYEKGMNKLRDAEKSYGYKKEIMFIDRDPTDAFLNGVVPRAVKLGQKGKLPRTVHLNLASGDNLNSRSAVITALKKDKDAKISIVNNNNGDGFAELITDRKQALKYLEGLVYDKTTLQKNLYTALKKKYGIEKIPDNIALGLGLKSSDLRRSIQPKLKL